MSQSLENLSLSDHTGDETGKAQHETSVNDFSWYECDDGEITTVDADRLALRLAPMSNGGTSYATPYMLLYTKACH
jgi:hypothetical protein